MTQITMQLSYQCCTRLITARMLPGRDGQPVHVQVHVDLATLHNQPTSAGGTSSTGGTGGTDSGGGAGTRDSAGSTGNMGGTDSAGSTGNMGGTDSAGNIGGTGSPGTMGGTGGADSTDGTSGADGTDGMGSMDGMGGAGSTGGAGPEAGDGPGPGAGRNPGLETARGPGAGWNQGAGAGWNQGAGAGWSPGAGAGWSPGAGAAWSPARAAASPGSVYLTGTDAEAAACDATLTPVVSGQINWTALDQLTTLFLHAHGHGPGHHRDRTPAPGQDGGGRPRTAGEPPGISPALHKRLRDTLLQMSIDLLSGPGGLASCLRAATLGQPYNSLSQPLDIGAPTPEVPPHLRKAVTQRDQHCQFPGCTQPPSVCQVHHLIPRSQGGTTALGNLRLLCRFHHLVVIHRWGWKLACHPDGTTTATSPNGRTLHSHGSPSHVA